MAKLNSNSIYIDNNDNNNFYMDSFNRVASACCSLNNSVSAPISTSYTLNNDFAVKGEVSANYTTFDDICSIVNNANTMGDTLKELADRIKALESKVIPRPNDFKNSFSNLNNNKGLRRGILKTLN